MDEATAHFTFNAACGMSVFGAMASMILGLKDLQVGAALFLLISLALCAVSLMAYKQYTYLRNKRWKQELKESEDKLNQVLNHARMQQIVSHVAGPLGDEALGEKGEQPVARP